MQPEERQENCIVTDWCCLEPVWAAFSLLTGEKEHTLVTELYGEARTENWKKKYHFLFEVFPVIGKYQYMNLMDFLLDLPVGEITFESYREALFALPEEELLWRMLDFGRIPEASKAVLQRAVLDDEAMEEVYGWSFEEESFLQLSAFVRQSRKFIAELFMLAEELRSDRLQEFLDEQKEKTQKRLEEIQKGIAEKGGFAFSEETLGKTFRNRGPYSEFVFALSYFIPIKACRYFHTDGEKKRQILFLSNRDVKRSDEDTVAVLKSISDKARYRILSLLAKEGPMRGIDIAKKVSLATSTVSHHMEQLKESGMITEEQVKSAKYFGINRQSVKVLLEDLKNDFDVDSL